MSTASIPMPQSAFSHYQGDHTRRKILIVDDNLVILKTLGSKLEASGYLVLTAEDGSSAVSIARREQPDLILLDLCFPPDVAHGGGVAWDGFLILNWLRRMEEAVNTPIVIISNDDSPITRQRCLEAGVAGYFHKPIDRDQLLGMVERILGTNAGG